MAVHGKNIWVAAGDGDLERVRELIELHSAPPNGPDANSYTPMHAAASYGHIDLLQYLLSKGGDVNITDDDGDTPLYTVENIETARFLVQHGAIVDRRNNEGISPIEHLAEDFPPVAEYLRSISTASSQQGSITSSVNQPSQHSQDVASEHLTSALMTSVRDIMERAEADGRDPEQDLHQAVTRAVLEGVVTGYEMSAENTDRERNQPPTAGEEGTSAKRSRTNE